MRRLLARLCLIALAGLVLYFALLNRQSVVLRLPFSDHALAMPLFFVFAAGTMVGIGLAMLVGVGPAIARYRARRAAERRAHSAEQALRASREQEAAARRQAAEAAIDRAQTGQAFPPARVGLR